MANLFKLLPSVDVALRSLGPDTALAGVPRPMLRDLANEFLELCREEIRSGLLDSPEQLEEGPLLERMAAHVRLRSRPHFRRVINATGVVVHTNLGRSLLCDEALDAVHEANRWYSNLEFDLATGKRGTRYSHVEELLCRVSGAEAALVVNNNAAAVLLVLDTLAKGREVIVSRGQLVEIGGSFRIPEVMEKSGAVLKEVGATNRTHLHDYEAAIGENTAALMKVHASNFRIVGFTKEVPLAELVRLGRERGLPVIDDLGSGNFTDFRAVGLGHEPTVQEAVSTGADLITFSGDKVLGGPQAGIIVGRREIIEKVKKNAMNRALRIDKMTLAALEATLRLYLDPELARQRIPSLRMITAPLEEVTARARKLQRRLRRDEFLSGRLEVSTRAGASRVGGGAFPEYGLKTTLLALACKSASAEALRDALLATAPPLVGRIEDDLFCLDPRTLDDAELPLVAEVLRQALANLPPAG